ncbi:hypothetical protein LB503_002069 [Fusarium chuoi]|nr:hypothetical protein LB503_002069 [Fusarium chuoi]
MSDHLFVEDIDDAELPGALQRLNNTQLNRTVQGLDSNQIPRVLLAIKSMNDEQGRRIIQRLDPSTDNRIQTFGGVMFWGTNIQSGPGKPGHPTFCDKVPHKTVDDLTVHYFLLKQNGVLWSHVEGAPNEYMCRACVNDKPGSFNKYDLNDLNAHISENHAIKPYSLDTSLKGSYGQHLGQRPGYYYEL